MKSRLFSVFVAFCVATVLTQIILFGYFLTRGAVNGETMTKVVALLNGIDISGNRLQQILRQSEDREQPDFDDILQARKMESYDMDLRLRSEKEFSDDLSIQLAELTDERERLDDRVDAFQRELEQIREGAQEKGLQDVQRILQSLDADKAKEHLLIMYDNEKIFDVVTIVQAMPTEKRKDILAEFVTKEETEKLAEILRLIGEGMPITALINEASGGR